MKVKAMNREQLIEALEKSLRYKTGVSRQIVELQLKQLKEVVPDGR